MKKTPPFVDPLGTVVILAFFLLFSCGGDTTSERRAERAAGARGDIVVGIVDSLEKSGHFRKGAELAIKEINGKGGVLGRNLAPLFYTDDNDDSDGERIARELAENLDVTAVIGHLSPDAAVAASVIYEQAGVVFLSYGVANPALMQFGGAYTFSDIPNTEEVGRRLVKLAKDAEKRKAVVFFERTPGVRRFVDIFHAQASLNEVEIVAVRSFFSYEHDFRSIRWRYDFKNIIRDLKGEYEFNAIFIVGDVRPASVLIRQLRALEVDDLIFGAGGLDSARLLRDAGEAAEGMIVATVFNPHHPGRPTRLFVERFTSEYGVLPDQWAAQAYDSVRILAAAIRESDSAEPARIGEVLRFFKDWRGASGLHTFTPDGHIVDETTFFKKIVDGKFEYLSSK